MDSRQHPFQRWAYYVMVEEERERKGESPEGNELSMFLELPSAAGSYPSFSPPVLGMSQEGSVTSWGHRVGGVARGLPPYSTVFCSINLLGFTLSSDCPPQGRRGEIYQPGPPPTKTNFCSLG